MSYDSVLILVLINKLEGKKPSNLLSLCWRGNRNSSELRVFIHSDTTDRVDQRLTD